MARERGARCERIPPGLRYMAASAFFFSLMYLLVKVAGRRLPSQEVVLARAVITAALSYAALRGAGVAALGTKRKLLLLRGVLGFVALSCTYYAAVHLPLAEATVIQYTNPIFTALGAAWLLRERMGGREAACVVGSLVGVVLVAQPSLLFGSGARLDPFAAAVALVGALLSASAYVVVRKIGEAEHPLVIVYYLALVSAVGSLPVLATSAVWPRPWEWLLLLGVGLTTQAAQVYMTRGLQLERAGRATSIGYLQIVLAALWGIVFFGEIPDRWSVAGASLIIGSTLALSRSERPEAAAPARPTSEAA